MLFFIEFKFNDKYIIINLDFSKIIILIKIV